MPPWRKWTRCSAITEKLSAQAYADFGIGGCRAHPVNDIMSVRETAPQMVDHFEGHTRAFLQVQNGCDHRCTFCIIPFGRGHIPQRAAWARWWPKPGVWWKRALPRSC